MFDVVAEFVVADVVDVAVSSVVVAVVAVANVDVAADASIRITLAPLHRPPHMESCILHEHKPHTHRIVYANYGNKESSNFNITAVSRLIKTVRWIVRWYRPAAEP